MSEMLHCGSIMDGAAIAFGDLHCLRLLVTYTSGKDWTYLYIPACNYKFKVDDAVTWNDDGQMTWYSNDRVTRFELLNVALRIQ